MSNPAADACKYGSWLVVTSPQQNGGLNPNSLTHHILVSVFSSLAIYNGFEVIVMVFLTFKRYRGAYFWSLLTAAEGIILLSVANILDLGSGSENKESRYGVTAIATVGWWSMVTGQAFVLWSRLHSVLHGNRLDTTLQWTRWMIIVNVALLHVPTTVMGFTLQSREYNEAFGNAFAILLKLEVTGFFVQETILSSIYIWHATKMLQTPLLDREPKSFWNRTSVILKELIAINAVIILMDLVVVILQALSLSTIQTLAKSLIYSLKLKLEFAILGKLKKCVNKGGLVARSHGMVFGPQDAEGRTPAFNVKGMVGGHTSGGSKPGSPQVIERNDSAFVDLESTKSNITVPARACSTARVTGRDIDYDLARFRHADSVTRLE